eukprot:TRINITY_DN6504_c0_g1_i1.p3 TRINITY_DN6504_c0_g1~~TRINITY_DN6504_c0_g1_i1.p3  ORF type:complete len:187 (-),score=92.15 TRINITY_DN6504_c0_g1_i1:96-656(-)
MQAYYREKLATREALEAAERDRLDVLALANASLRLADADEPAQLADGHSHERGDADAAGAAKRERSKAPVSAEEQQAATRRAHKRFADRLPPEEFDELLAQLKDHFLNGGSVSGSADVWRDKLAANDVYALRRETLRELESLHRESILARFARGDPLFVVRDAHPWLTEPLARRLRKEARTQQPAE